MSSALGDQSAFFYIEVQDGAPISFQVRASFKGPTIKIIEPVIDYGLVKINTSSKYRVTVENTSPIPCEVLLRAFRHDHITFDNYQKHVDSIRQIYTAESNCLHVEKALLTLGPSARGDFLITLDAKTQETVEEYFELLVKNSDTPLYFQVMAEIQKPRVCLNRNVVKLETIYAGVMERIDIDHKQSLVLKNYGNIPV